MAVEMDWMTIHAEVGETYSYPLTQFDDQRVSSRPDPAIESEDVEISHHIGIRGEGPRANRPFLKKDEEMPIDRLGISIPRMDDEKTLHAHRHLDHLIRMRVIHLRPVLVQSELIGISFTRGNVFLSHTADSIHSVRRKDTMPVHGSWFGQFVSHQNANAIAFHCLNCRTGALTIVTPAVHCHAWSKFTSHRFGHKVKLFSPILHRPG